MQVTNKELSWSPDLIKRLRGKRTQTEFGLLLKVPKNTVWRWEAGEAKPASENARRLSALAERESFLRDWKLVGSIEILGDLEHGTKRIREMFKKSLVRSVQRLAD